jgi:hypothetical protein
MALSGPAHYAKADELLAEIEATPAPIQRDRDLAHDPGRRARGPCRSSRHRAELPSVAPFRRGRASPGAEAHGCRQVRGRPGLVMTNLLDRIRAQGDPTSRH